ncbi:MAG: hypothetical protein Q9164_005255 [Protoblastenia rupestris]
MGLLSDITATANNTKRHANTTSNAHQSLLSPEKENLGTTRSPHFMTPTFASKNSTTTLTNQRDFSETPVSIKSSNQDNTNAFLKSAAKRVGLRRTGDGILRSKKEAVLNDNRNIPLPDKLPDSPPSAQKQPTKVSRCDKPLPSPPIAQVDTSSPNKVSASLIDASVPPLRRCPTGMTNPGEEWPMLHPQRVASPGTLQELMRETGSQLKEQPMLPNGERFPKLGDSTRKLTAEQLPVSRLSAQHYHALNETTAANTQTATTDTRAIDPFGDTENLTNQDDERQEMETAPSHLSAGAAAVEKSAFQSSIEPRQTRTSSLRARLSTGSIVTDSNSKIIGFTDFTAPHEPAAGPNGRDSFRLRKEAQARSNTFPAATNLSTQASRESIGVNRAPAKFIAGSRRPVPPRRPGSRSSIRVDGRPPSPSATRRPPSLGAPPVPPMKDGTSYNLMRPDLPLRRSSIPVSSTAVANAQDRLNATGMANMNLNMDSHTTKQVPRGDFNIFEDRSVFNSGKDDRHRTVMSSKKDVAKMAIAADRKQVLGLEAIAESPRHTYELKRLSTKSPEFGPVLSISPSAEKYIMGLDDNKENRPLDKDKSRDLKQAPKTNVQAPQINGRISSATKNRLERPLSSHGVTQSSPRSGLADPKVREKKARSVEFSSAVETKTLGLVTAEPLSKNLSVATTASSTNDPFYDANEELGGDADVTPKTEIECHSIPRDHDCTSPLARKSKPSEVTSISTTPATIGEESSVTSNTVEEYDPFKYDTAAAHNALKQDQKDKLCVKVWPLNPEQTAPTDAATSSSCPQPSSSRTDQSNVTVSSNKTLSFDPAAKIQDQPSPPKEFVRRQNNLGSTRGHGSSEVDLAKSSTKRESAARDAFKSQTSLPYSLSKSRFNFKTLFHKRTAVGSEISKSSKKNKSKVIMNGNGGPFPPISEVHPIHRPTLSSSNRSSAPTSRHSTVTSTNLSSGPTPRQSTTISTSRPLTPATPAISSPSPNEVSRATSLAMALLDSARKESSSPKKEKLLQLGKIVVDVITQARDAERAVEEAKLAAKRADKAYEGCKRAVGEVGRLVEMMRGGRGTF